MRFFAITIVFFEAGDELLLVLPENGPASESGGQGLGKAVASGCENNGRRYT